MQSSAGGGGLGSSLLGGSYAVLCEALVPQSQSQSQRGSLGSLGSLLSFGLLSVCQVGSVTDYADNIDRSCGRRRDVQCNVT